MNAQHQGETTHLAREEEGKRNWLAGRDADTLSGGKTKA